MNKLNKKGFTLVELIATIVLLALVMGIGSYAITNVIKSSKEKDYELLITNIKSGVEAYYQECKYSDGGYVDCPLIDGEGYYSIKLGALVEYGYLKGNSTISSGVNKDKFTLVNPSDNADISECLIKYKYDSGKMKIITSSTGDSCPTSY